MGTESVFIFINGIMVGMLPPEQYELLVAKAKKDWRLYVIQILNCGYAAFLVGGLILIITPIILFWILLMLDVYAQAEFALFIEAVSKPPESFPLGLLTITRYLVILSIPVSGLGMAFYRKVPGFRNVFFNAVCKSACAKIGVRSDVNHVTLRKDRWHDVQVDKKH